MAQRLASEGPVSEPAGSLPPVIPGVRTVGGKGCRRVASVLAVTVATSHGKMDPLRYSEAPSPIGGVDAAEDCD